MSRNELLYDKTIRAIDKVMSDTSVPVEDTKISLNSIIEHCNICLDALGD